jgi:hypothetical protein
VIVRFCPDTIKLADRSTPIFLKARRISELLIIRFSSVSAGFRPVQKKFQTCRRRKMAVSPDNKDAIENPAGWRPRNRQATLLSSFPRMRFWHAEAIPLLKCILHPSPQQPQLLGPLFFLLLLRDCSCCSSKMFAAGVKLGCIVEQLSK